MYKVDYRRVIEHFSKPLSGHENNYCVILHELLALGRNLNTFHPYISSHSQKENVGARKIANPITI